MQLYPLHCLPPQEAQLNEIADQAGEEVKEADSDNEISKRPREREGDERWAAR